MFRRKISAQIRLFFFGALTGVAPTAGFAQVTARSAHADTAFAQPYSVKYFADDNATAVLRRVRCDRNGIVQVITSGGLWKPSGGRLLYPGRLIPDLSYTPMTDKKIAAIGLYRDQFVYLDDQAVLSNAWAGKLYDRHDMPGATVFCGGDDFSFLLSDGRSLRYVRDSRVLWTGESGGAITDILFDAKAQVFWLLGEHGISAFDPASQSVRPILAREGLTCFAQTSAGNLVAGTHDGYFTVNPATGAASAVTNHIPCADITAIRQIGDTLWFGSAKGAFFPEPGGKYKYFASKRWLPSDKVADIAEGPGHSVLVLTDKGLGEIRFSRMTLADKADYFEKQVRARHIRLGLNATMAGLKNGNVDSGSLEDSDNDGLWTSMYLGAEVFRYAATHSAEALQNCRESLDAMERLYTVSPVKGFPARSFERSGYEISDVRHRKPKSNPALTPEYPGNAGLNDTSGPWKHTTDPEWDWKSTTSSDEAIGHMFVFGVIAELVDDSALRNKAIRLMDALMNHIVEHRMYLVDWDGKPTLWGRWNPEYVNARPVMVGDRKITSSNIISMLQTAYHFTGRKKYRDKALELLTKYGYLENLMRPMSQVGRAPEDADELSKDLSEGWNHSDDEMYFLGYWGLYRYALNDTLKQKFRAAILDHWEIERPEKEGAWDIFAAITGVKDFDLPEAVWYLQKYPLDLVNWKVRNSDRRDIEFIPDNFRRQTIREVLPPDELPIERHNANCFDLDGGDENGSAENSAGDIWLLPYWMGRYLRAIAAPVQARVSATKIIPGAVADARFEQRFSVKYFFPDSTLSPQQVATDRNGNIRVLASGTLFSPSNGALLRPGILQKDLSYLPTSEKKLVDLGAYRGEFVYLDDEAVLSNGWSGTLYDRHGMAGARIFCAGDDFSFLVASGAQVALTRAGRKVWEKDIDAPVLDIRFAGHRFWVLTEKNVFSFASSTGTETKVFAGEGFTCFHPEERRLLIGTHEGCLDLSLPRNGRPPLRKKRLPCNDLTAIERIGGDLWFGSLQGAFREKSGGGFDCFASERWLPGNRVVSLAAKGRDVLVLTDKGLAEIRTRPASLADKAAYYERIARERHIRYGFYCDYTTVAGGDVARTTLRPHDSDNLWTSMYLGGELFRYLATGDPEAKQNCVESLDAMERLFTLSGIPGLFGRCIERRGVVDFKPEIREENKLYWYPGYDSVPSSWQHSADREWDWRGSASSDQAVGQYFAWTLVAQYMPDTALRARAIRLIDALTGYIVDHDLQIVDVDGRPTLWGRWNPAYVNRMPDGVGDKKLYSSNIIAFLQTAWHFTGREKYREKINELLYRDHYLENLLRPLAKIGPAPAGADAWSKLLSEGWNSSDDEMYFLAYWGLYPYAPNDSLKKAFGEAIRDHTAHIRPEKEWLWDLCYTAITGARDWDAAGTMWSLRRMPLDGIDWRMENSRRGDIARVPANFFGQTTADVLPPDERPENKHNRNLFTLDSEGRGDAELGGGDTFLLPYWMGRYFKRIAAPSGTETAKPDEELFQ